MSNLRDVIVCRVRAEDIAVTRALRPRHRDAAVENLSESKSASDDNEAMRREVLDTDTSDDIKLEMRRGKSGWLGWMRCG